jgi:hypothetical protein
MYESMIASGKADAAGTTDIRKELYDLTGGGSNNMRSSLPAGGYTWYGSLTDAEKDALASVSVVKCPTRRGGIARTRSETTHWQGPQTDYAIPKTHIRRVSNSTNAGFTNYAWQTRGEFSRGPFRVALYNPPNFESSRLITRWEARDDLGRWASDGASNQIVIGEKAIPTDRLGQCEAGQTGQTGAWDCSFLSATFDDSDAHTTHFVRTFEGAYNSSFANMNYLTNFGDTRPTRALARPMASDASGSTTYLYQFGSWHPGISNLAMGDGSVRSVSVTTPGIILLILSHVDTGQTSSLP